MMDLDRGEKPWKVILDDAERDDFRVCSCIAIDHDHQPNRCEEPPNYRGGTCTSCRLWAYHRDIDGATDDEAES